jgi:hypothetical protein
MGEGSWVGNFATIQGNIGPISGGYFTNPSWSGIEAGWGIGAPVGLIGGEETYIPVPGSLEDDPCM